VKATILISVVVAALSVAAAGCGSDNDDSGSSVAANCKPKHHFTTLKDGTLTVSSYSYPPSTVVEGSDLTGIEGEMLDKISQMECVNIDVTEQAAPGVVTAVQSGRADMAAGDWYRTKDRAKVLNLTDPLYNDQIVFVSQNGDVKSVDDLIGKRVGSTEGNLFNEDVEKLIGDDFHSYQTTLEAYQDLANGRLDVVIDGAAGATDSLKKIGNDELQMAVPPPDPRVGATIQPGQAGWPVTKGNDALTQALNADIAEMRKSGEITRLLQEAGLPPEAAQVGKPVLL
jgi:polar amino acid transport system substrate-binding protein